jgi:hypothetical protein
MSVTRAFYYLALPSQHHKIVHPLLRILAVSPEVERVVLTYILSISHAAPVRHWHNSFRAYLIIARSVAPVLLTLYPIYRSRR